MPTVALSAFRGLIALAYTFGGAVHVANLAGYGPPHPTDKKRVFTALDVGYFGLDIAVVIGMMTGATWGFVAFFVAAGSQIALYVGFTEYFASSTDQRRQIRGLVRFHLATTALMASLLALT